MSKGLVYVKGKRPLREDARRLLAKRVAASTRGNVAMLARAGEYTLETALSGGELLERTCAKLEAFVAGAK